MQKSSLIKYSINRMTQLTFVPIHSCSVCKLQFVDSLQRNPYIFLTRRKWNKILHERAVCLTGRDTLNPLTSLCTAHCWCTRDVAPIKLGGLTKALCLHLLGCMYWVPSRRWMWFRSYFLLYGSIKYDFCKMVNLNVSRKYCVSHRMTIDTEKSRSLLVIQN